MKLDVIAASLDQVSEPQGGPPLVVGLGEIENNDLARRLASKVITASLKSVDDLVEDETGFALDGLNLAMLVDPSVAEVIRVRSHVIDRTFDTRDILEVDLVTAGQPWSVLVNHWPSRLSAEGEGRRIAAAHYASRLVHDKVRYSITEMWNPQRERLVPPLMDDIVSRARTPVLVMGDFNDEVFDASLEVLHATPELDEVIDDIDVSGRSYRERFRTYQASEYRVLNPFWTFSGSEGSYYRSPRWRTYDQILFSRGFCETWTNQPVRYLPGTAAIHQVLPVTLPDGREWPATNRNGKPIPFEPENNRGCSDHFPVCGSVEIA